MSRTLVVATLAVFVFALAAVLLSLRNPHVVAYAELRTERLQVVTVDPQKSAFHIAGVRAGPIGQPPGACSTGLFSPARGTVVTYTRLGAGPLGITLDPPPTVAGQARESSAVASFEPDDRSGSRTLLGVQYIEMDKSCPDAIADRLPFWGDLEAGAEFRPASIGPPEPSFLLSGKLTVAAHAFWTNALYQVAEISLPIGGRLQTYGPDRSPNRAIWWGTVSLAEPGALDVVAGTLAPKLAVYYPYQRDADIIELSKLAQLTADPTVVRLGVLFAILIFLVDRLAKLAALLHDDETERDYRQREQSADVPPPTA